MASHFGKTESDEINAKVSRFWPLLAPDITEGGGYQPSFLPW
jgi:hypothetical protein